MSCLSQDPPGANGMAVANSITEQARLKALEEYHNLDTLPEVSYDRIISILAEVCQTPIALFALVDKERLWIKAAHGLAISQVPRKLSICAYVVQGNDTLVIEDTHSDPRFSDNPLVRDVPHVRSYAGVPVRARGGEVLGTLCVIDRVPRKLSGDQLRIIEELAREIETQLELRRTIRALEHSLEERSVQTAMVTHDAHNLITLMLGTLERAGDPEAAVPGEIESLGALLHRLGRMCENFVSVNRTDRRDLKTSRREFDVREWLGDLQLREVGRARQSGIELTYDVPPSSIQLVADSHLLDRVMSNLLDNAFRACQGGGRIQISAALAPDGHVELAVEDDGPGVPEEIRAQIFEPYFSQRSDGTRGSGLGLTFCSVALEKLGGGIACDRSQAGGARFAIRIPRAS